MIPPSPVKGHRPARWMRHFQEGRLGQPVPRPESTAGRWAHVVWRWNRFAVLLFKSSLIVTLIAGLVKIVLGAIALSPFVVANGLYSLGVGSARSACLTTDDEQDNLQYQYHRYRFVGIVVAIASALYVIYSLRLLFVRDNLRFSFIMALGIATITFVEFGVNIQQAVTKRRHPSPLLHAAKLTASASSIIGLSLVQVALLSMTEPETDHSRYNAWGGIFCGGIAIAIGLGMIIRSSHHLRRLAVG